MSNALTTSQAIEALIESFGYEVSDFDFYCDFDPITRLKQERSIKEQFVKF